MAATHGAAVQDAAGVVAARRSPEGSTGRAGAGALSGAAALVGAAGPSGGAAAAGAHGEDCSEGVAR